SSPDLRSFEWHYLQRLCRMDMQTLEDHRPDRLELPNPEAATNINSIAFSADGARLAYARRFAIKIWDVANGQKLLEFPVSMATQVLSIAWSRDGRLIAVGGAEKDILVFDADSGKQRFVLSGHTGPVEALAFTPDGFRIVSGSRDQSVRVWELTTAKA